MAHFLSHVALIVGPFFLDFIDYPLPIAIPGTHASILSNFIINYVYQVFWIGYGLIFIFLYDIIFILFTAHLLTELKIMHKVLEKVGDFEEQEFLIDLERELKPKQECKVLTPTTVPKNPRELDLELMREICEELANDTIEIVPEKPVAGPSNATTTEDEDSVAHFQEIYNFLYENQTEEAVSIKSSIILRNLVIMHIDIIR